MKQNKTASGDKTQACLTICQTSFRYKEYEEASRVLSKADFFSFQLLAWLSWCNLRHLQTFFGRKILRNYHFLAVCGSIRSGRRTGGQRSRCWDKGHVGLMVKYVVRMPSWRGSPSLLVTSRPRQSHNGPNSAVRFMRLLTSASKEESFRSVEMGFGKKKRWLGSVGFYWLC